MKITAIADRPTRKAPEAYFTGQVTLDDIHPLSPPSRMKALRVSFAPGARTAWHTHPIGQALHVLSGRGIVQLHGQQPRLIHPGDSVWIEPNELHWHGATATHGMVHLAMQETDDTGTDAVWLQQVTDDEYNHPAL